ncbi:hypothetical protein COLO4_00339, partial [Corchorus olitorius]
ERLQSKTEVSNTSLPIPRHENNVKADVTASKVSPATERSQISEPFFVPSSSSKVSAPLFTKKVKSSDSRDVMKGAEKNAGPSQVNGVMEVKNLQAQRCSTPSLKLQNNQHQEVKTTVGEVNQLQSQGPSRSNPFLKSSNKEEGKKVGEVTGAQSHRASNPFLKSTVK